MRLTLVQLDELIQQTRTLAPLPATAVRLATMTASGKADLGEISEVIAYDQALTLRLLRAANSAAVGGALRTTRVHDAVFRLGTARVLALAVASGVSGLLKSDVPAYGLREGELWRHSVAAATAAETLPEFATQELPQETLAAALLHDVGKLVMGRHLTPEDLERLGRAQSEFGRDPLAAETEVLSVHHGELGGLVAQRWGLPERIVKGIIHHHHPGDGLDVVCDAVYLANLMAKHIEGSPAAVPDHESLERLGVDESCLDRLLTSARNRYQTVRARYHAV